MRRHYTLGRFLALVTAVTLLGITVMLMLTDNPAPEPSDVREQMPVTINGEDGYRCDFTVESNGDRADTAHASCETAP